LPQKLNFANAPHEHWRMSLAEMIYHPGKWFNIRESNNLVELKIQDWAREIHVNRNVYAFSWELRDTAEHIKSPGTYTRVVSSYLQEEYIKAYDHGPGEKRAFDPKKADKPVLRLYAYKRKTSRRLLGFTKVTFEFEVWDSRINETPGSSLYKFDFDYREFPYDYLTQYYRINVLAITSTWNHPKGSVKDPWFGISRRPSRGKMPKVTYEVNKDNWNYLNPKPVVAIKLHKIYLPIGSYNHQTFKLMFNEEVEKGLTTLYGSSKKQQGVLKWPLNYNGENKEPPMFFMDINEKDGRYFVTFNIDDDYHLATKLSFHINADLQYLMGLVSNIGKHFGSVWWNVKSSMREEGKGEIRSSLTYLKKTFPYEIDLTRGTLRKMYVHCNICKPIIVNDQREQILRMVALDVFSGTAQLPFPFEFHEICDSNVSAIKIWFTEDVLNAAPINIQDEIYVKIIFQQVAG